MFSELDSAMAVAVLDPIVDFKLPSTTAAPEAMVAEIYLNKRKRKERDQHMLGTYGTHISIDGHSKSSSSSIGEGSLLDGEGDNEEGEVQSQLKKDPLGCLDSLVDAIPIKKGLSNYFSGKLKSFVSLSDAATTKDLEKPENPFSKRRRILMANKVFLSSKASYESLNRVSFKTHDLPLVEEDEEENKDYKSPLSYLQRQQ